MSARGPRDEAARPRPRLQTLTLLVGRISTIKLAYWTALTASEILIGALDRPFADRFALSLAAMAVFTLAALAWSALSARALDRRAGGIERSIPTVATAFVSASVVASPASLPLLIVERQRSVEGCAPAVCHWEAIWYWVAALAIGTVLVPLVFAIRLRPESREAA